MIKTEGKTNIFRLLFWAGDYPALEWGWFVLGFLVLLTLLIIGFK